MTKEELDKILKDHKEWLENDGKSGVRAELEDADLSYAILDGADLTDADLNGANLTNASLRKANLTNARLSGVNFTGINLDGAITKNVILGNRYEAK